MILIILALLIAGALGWAAQEGDAYVNNLRFPLEESEP